MSSIGILFLFMSIKKNFAYSAILTCSGYVFTFITYPYVSRVLGVENIGICNFVSSVVQYFLLFSTMGIMSVGTREIAKCNGDREALSKTFSSLMAINLILTGIVSVIYLACVFLISALSEYRHLLYVGLLQIVLTPFLIEWFFKGIETFRYITIRSLIVKMLYVLSIFIFVRKPEDYGTYFFLSCAMMVLNAGFNWVYKGKFVTFSLSKVNIRPYVKGVIILGIYSLLTSMYTTFNTAYLGFISGPVEVGYYSTAMKIQTIILAIYTAFTSVMIPRMSALMGQNRQSEVNRLIYKSFDALYLFSVPLVVFSTVFAPQIVRIISGAGYEPAVIPMRIVMPLILIIGIEQILVLQILMPYKADSAILRNSIIGAVVGVAGNIVLVPLLGSIGSAIVSLISECAVLFSALINTAEKINILTFFKLLLRNLFYVLPIGILLYLIDRCFPFMLSFFVGAVSIILSWTVLQYYIARNEITTTLVNSIFKRIKSNEIH